MRGGKVEGEGVKMRRGFSFGSCMIIKNENLQSSTIVINRSWQSSVVICVFSSKPGQLASVTSATSETTIVPPLPSDSSFSMVGILGPPNEVLSSELQ